MIPNEMHVEPELKDYYYSMKTLVVEKVSKKKKVMSVEF